MLAEGDAVVGRHGGGGQDTVRGGRNDAEGTAEPDELAARRPLTAEQKARLDSVEGRIIMASVAKLIVRRHRRDVRADADELQSIIYEQFVHAARVFDPSLANESGWAGFASRYVYQRVLVELDSPRYRRLGWGAKVQDFAEGGYVIDYPQPLPVKLEDIGDEARASAADRRDAEVTAQFAKKRLRFHLGVEQMWSLGGIDRNDPEALLSYQQQVGPVLQEAIAKLPEPDRSLVTGYFWDNKSLTELGAALEGGRSARTARRALNRALTELGRGLVYQGIDSVPLR